MEVRKSLSCLCVLWLVSAAASAAPEKSRHVLIIGIDGCRRDALEAAKTPHLDALAAGGTFFIDTEILAPQPRNDGEDGADARPDAPPQRPDTVSGPGWSNLLTGVWPAKHGALDNSFKGTNYKQFPHFFQRLKEARPTARTASFSDWGPIAEKILSGADHVDSRPAHGVDDYVVRDAELTLACSSHLRETAVDAVVLYLGQVDEAGHTYGFHPTVSEYTRAIATVDGHIGQVLTTIRERPTAASEDWLVIVCTDHGGTGLDHARGHSNPDIRKTFLIVSPRAAHGRSEQPTWQVDVVATALDHLMVPLQPEWHLDGHSRILRMPQ